MQEQLIWEVVPADGCFFSEVAFGDGSGVHGQRNLTRRCAFAVASFDYAGSEVVVNALARGPLVGLNQQVPASELKAWIVYLRFSATEVLTRTYFTDCLWVITTFAKGKYAATNGWAIHADLWRELFALVEDVGFDTVFLRKTKAHKAIDACRSIAEVREAKCNAIVDQKARQSAKQGHDDNTEAMKQHDDLLCRATVVAKYLARLQIWLRDNHTFEVELPAKFVPQPSAPQNLSVDGMGEHVASTLSARASSEEYIDLQPPMWDVEALEFQHASAADRVVNAHLLDHDPLTQKWRCLACMAFASQISRMPLVCLPPVVGKRHVYWIAGAVRFCKACGAYSKLRTRHLALGCPGKPIGQDMWRQKQALLAGTHPMTREFLGVPMPYFPLATIAASRASRATEDANLCVWEFQEQHEAVQALDHQDLLHELQFL